MIEINILIKNFRYRRFIEKIVSKLEQIEKLKNKKISLLITGDKIIKELNKKYRKKNKTTDVLSFAERDIRNNFYFNDNFYLGEIIINIEQAKRQSENFKKEILILLIHGYLHLIGYDHDNLQKEVCMNKQLQRIIKKYDI
ncbi:MAG TPA: rRNA maturation RNase YbeY [bacterium]|jgi:probable rRNA maturation factor|nr:rRNA maturation RNase YbeY [bacterium]HOG38361.1 rRNA maturation RNase YbeY [bacterium]HQI03263.1 rRNA maturation RNase YbeY [bacterium]